MVELGYNKKGDKIMSCNTIPRSQFEIISVINYNYSGVPMSIRHYQTFEEAYDYIAKKLKTELVEKVVENSRTIRYYANKEHGDYCDVIFGLFTYDKTRPLIKSEDYYWNYEEKEEQKTTKIINK